MPIVRHHLTVQHCNRRGPEMMVERLHQAEGFDRLGDVNMRPHRQCMNPGIGAARSVERGRLAGGCLHCSLDRLLDNEMKDYAKAFLFAVGHQLSQRLRHTSRKVGHLAFLDVTGRIARTLLDLCKQPDAMTHPDGMQLRITRQEIGRIVGCSREMVGRVLKSLEEQGLITASGKTIVVFGTR